MRALSDQVPLELRQGRKDIEHEAAAGGGGVDGFLHGLEADTTVGQSPDGVDEVGEGPAEAVEPPDDQGVAVAGVVEAGGQLRPVSERPARSGLDITQVPRGFTMVAWYWKCDHGHRWRETTYSRLDLPMLSAHASRTTRRWKSIGGTRAACRQCVLDDYGAKCAKCGHTDPDLNLVNNPRQVLDGWCRSCKDNAGPQLGDAFHANHAPPTSDAEATMRAMLRVHLPIATPEEANAVRVRPTRWGALHVFPDLLIPATHIAIEYDSPGRWGDAHQDDSTDGAKDQALRDVGWDVIRIRTGGLAATSRWDVVASGPTLKGAHEVIRMYNRILMERPD
jgi:hypothetical protein